MRTENGYYGGKNCIYETVDLLNFFSDSVVYLSGDSMTLTLEFSIRPVCGPGTECFNVPILITAETICSELAILLLLIVNNVDVAFKM